MIDRPLDPSCPALYECTLCGEEWVWWEADGEASSFCPACAAKVHQPRRPRRIRYLTKDEAERRDIVGLRAEYV